MRLRWNQALTIVLLLASAAPPPRVSTLLLETGRLPFSQAKTPQVRGRNRVPSPLRPDQAGVEIRLGSGGKDIPPPLAFLGDELAADLAHCRKTFEPFLALPLGCRAYLPLRC